MKMKFPVWLAITIFLLSTQSLYAAVSANIGIQPPPVASKPITTPSITNIPTPTQNAVPVVNQPAASPAKGDEKLAIVAKVVWVRGVFKSTSPEHNPRVLKSADVIYLHDTLTSEADTKAQIVFTDDALMTFVPNSEFTINDYHYDPKGAGKDDSYVMSLVKGGFRTITGLVAKANPDGYKVITPVATIGVRGTDYAVFLKDGKLLVARYKGKPCVIPNGPNGSQAGLCLDENTKYLEEEQGKVPVPLNQQPPEFDQKGIIVNVTFIDQFEGMTMPGTITPGSVLSNFCIQ